MVYSISSYLSILIALCGDKNILVVLFKCSMNFYFTSLLRLLNLTTAHLFMLVHNETTTWAYWYYEKCLPYFHNCMFSTRCGKLSSVLQDHILYEL